MRRGVIAWKESPSDVCHSNFREVEEIKAVWSKFGLCVRAWGSEVLEQKLNYISDLPPCPVSVCLYSQIFLLFDRLELHSFVLMPLVSRLETLRAYLINHHSSTPCVFSSFW
jgi:hypothetical protein